MKNILLLTVFLALNLFAMEYTGKLEPFKTIKISSEVSGKVIFANEKDQFSYIENKTLILKIDTKDEDIELKALEESLKNQKEILAIQKQNHINKSKVKQLSIYEKNQEKLTYLQTQLIITDIEKSIKTLQNQKDKKEFFVKDFYITDLDVKEGENINIGDNLYSLYDFSKLKITLYLKPEDIKNINSKEIYIDDKKSEFKILNVSKVKDNLRVSTHKVELVQVDPNIDLIESGKIVKVEFR